MRQKVSAVSAPPSCGLEGLAKREGEGYVVTGTQDGLVNVFSLANGQSEASFTLIGHSHNVSALHALPDGTIISGSWDKYVIVHAT